jgi:hypothetical protein
VILVVFALAIGILMTGLIFRYTTRIQGLAWSFAGLLMPVMRILSHKGCPDACARSPGCCQLPIQQYPTRNTPSRRRKAAPCWSSWREAAAHRL